MKKTNYTFKKQLLVVVLLTLALAVLAQTGIENTAIIPQTGLHPNKQRQLIKEGYSESFAQMDQQELKMFNGSEMHEIQMKRLKRSKPEKSVSDNSLVSTTDSLALVALYNSTGGPNWTNKTNWLIGRVNTWYGITVTNGFVTSIFFGDNNLSGNIPIEIGNLIHLQDLILEDSQLSGSIPSTIGNLSNLQFLYLANSQFSGSIPSTIGNLSNLQSLYLNDNQLSGIIPSTIGSLSNLQSLWLQGNQLTGSIPMEIGNLSNLLELCLNGNQLSGSIPVGIGNLTNLHDLWLNNNLLTGSVPLVVGNLTQLQYFFLCYNQLTGSIPPGIGNLNLLEWLDFSYNQLTGNIPPEIGSLNSILSISLDQNQLIGSIPHQIGNLSSLQYYLNLSSNQLTGEIPIELGNLADVEYIFLYNNQLSGMIPIEIGNLSSLNRLLISDNHLTGSIPVSIGNLTSTEVIALSNNQLSGNIPIEICDAPSLGYFDFSDNYLNVGSCPAIECLLNNGVYLPSGIQLNGLNLLTDCASPPTADAGFDQTICEDQTAQLNGLATYYSALSWTGNVSNPSILNPVYTPTAADIAAGFVQFCLTAYPIPPQTIVATDCMIITIISLPEDNAGADETIGETETFTTNPIVTNASQTFWTTTGDGWFDDVYSEITVYYPGPTDIATGSVELCLLAVGEAPCESQVEDCMVLTIGQTMSDIISLNPGWNLISFDVTPSPATPVSVFAPLIANNNLLMVTSYEQGGVMFDPNGLPFLNTLSEIKNGYGYWVKVTNAATLNVSGAHISPAFAMNLKSGWNLVAYWPAETITPEVAFTQLISLGILQTVTGYELGGKFFDPNGPAFLNTLTEIKNGFGYWVKVSADFNGFTYPLPWACGDNFTDSRDGKVYTTVQIGTQCWMKQNLNIGTRIVGANSQTNNGTIEKYCYNNLETNCDVYGGLYQWDEMMQYSITPGVKGICPSNWHLPTDAEWSVLTTYLGGQSVAGGKMKEIGTTHWLSPNTGATNSSGFTGLPAGYRTTNGSFYGLGSYADFWSSTEYGGSSAWYRDLFYGISNVNRSNNEESYGFSVRCLKD